MAAGDGLVTMTPTSIAVAGAGSSASINSDGGVDFTSATSLSLNGVFTSSFDNYLVVIRHTEASSNNMNVRLRAAGTDASGGNYTNQFLGASSTTVSGVRQSSDTYFFWGSSDSTTSGDQVHVYGPGLAQPTACRSVNVRGLSGGAIQDRAGNHSLSTAYDGFTFLGGTFSGNIVVFGYEE